MNNEEAIFEPAVPRLLPPPKLPQDVARVLVPEHPTPLAYWQGDFYGWTGTHWASLERGRINTWLRLATERALYLGAPKKEGEAPPKFPWAPNTAKINELANALGEAVVPRFGDPDDCMAFENGVLDLAGRTLKEHSQSRFNLNSLPFGYDPGARCPEWLKFLESTLPGDHEAHRLLQEWFGYVLSGRKDIHKMMLLKGPKRCGKGTIAHTLQALVGRDAWAAPQLGQLAGNFGLESLIGRKLVVMGDVKWNASDVQKAIPILLALGSEDGFTINRKNRTDWHGYLGARVTMMSNDAPVLKDTSGALTGRLLLINLEESFFGREDLTLADRLGQELPGILNWALDGLDRLNERGRFAEPPSASGLRDEIERESSPVAAWVDDWCQLAPGEQVSMDAAFASFQKWCMEENRSNIGTRNRFSRDLKSAFMGKVEVLTGDHRPRNAQGVKVTTVVGLRVLPGYSFP